VGWQSLQRGIQERQEELHRIAAILASAARAKGSIASVAKTITISLGAFTATNAVAAKLWGADNRLLIILYTMTGLAIAAVSGLEAAFKLESRAAALRTLATNCQSTIWQIDSEWRKSIGSVSSSDFQSEEARSQAARLLLDRQDQVLADVQSKAAALGEDIAFHVRELYGPQPPAAA
jgi:hypothetical protein